MKKYFKIINVSRRQLALFLVYLATILFATAGIVSVMSYALVSPGGNNFTVYSEKLFKTSLVLPLIFFISFAISGLVILLTGKEGYRFSDQLLRQRFKFRILLTLIEIIQVVAWAFFLVILIGYFYPINKSLSHVYQDQLASLNFGNGCIKTGLLPYIHINNNFFADLKLSILNYAATVPFFFNKDMFSFANIIYFALYIALFIPYLKLSLFKKEERILSLVPFSSLLISLRPFYSENGDETLLKYNDAGLRWYQKILLSNRTVFQIKLTSTVVYLSFFFLIAVLAFLATAITLIIRTNENGYTLILSEKFINAYSINFLAIPSSEEYLLRYFRLSSFIIMMIIFIVFSMGIILDDNPYVFPKTIRKSKIGLSLSLIGIEIAQWSFLILFWGFFVANAEPQLVGLRDGNRILPQRFPYPIRTNPDYTYLLYSSSDLFSTTNLFFLALYFSWFLIYAKAGMFSKRTRIFMYIPFATLFFVSKHVIEKRKQVNKFNCV
ncbi:hypothetical protein [[Mycoplasma] imitans]|uniref:hypothetical protein n=1 Tax=[Mycoplasma] imitans TaxID=29560 RepID=UPI0004805683|nr:hypothetical protein [[Mycoplasma] imitans]